MRRYVKIIRLVVGRARLGRRRGRGGTLRGAALRVARGAPPGDARAARLAQFKREQGIVDYLNRGVSVAEIAARIGVGEKRMRAIIGEILVRRQPAPPQEFVAIQVSRLNVALLVAFSAMTDMNLKAVDRVVRIVRELDRYHGFAPARRRRPAPERLDARDEAADWPDASLIYRMSVAMQSHDETEETEQYHPFHHPRDPRTAVRGGGPEAAVTPLQQLYTSVGGAYGPERDDRPQNPPQSVENIDSAPGFSVAGSELPPPPSEERRRRRRVPKDLFRGRRRDDRGRRPPKARRGAAR